MSVPKQITINGCTIRTARVKNQYRNDGDYGSYLACDHTINLDADLNEQKEEIIYTHEVIEMILDMYLLKCDHEIIQPLAVALHDLIKTNQLNFDNPE